MRVSIFNVTTVIYTFTVLVAFLGQKVAAVISKQDYVLNMDKVPHLFYQTTITTILKSKAREDLQMLSQTERVAYKQCESSARSLLDLAKCVSKLIRMRSRHQHSVRNTTRVDFNISTKRILIPNLETQSIVKKRARIVRLHEHHERIRKRLRAKKLLKREVQSEENDNKNHRKIPENVKKLRRLQKYVKQVNECKTYMKHLEVQNERIFMTQNVNAMYHTESSSQDNHMDKILKFLDSNFSSIQILSPKLLEILPDIDDDRNILSSPSLLGLSEDQPLSLPRILKLSTRSDYETLEWLNIIIRISGVEKTLSMITENLESEMKHVEESIIPKIEEIKRMEQKVLALQDSLNRAQKEALRKQGYTRMTLEQANKFYVGDEELMQVIKEEESLEEMIHEMAEYKAPKRSKRQILQLRLLQPYAFVNKQLITSILGLNLLSPYAFYQTILAPKILSMDVLIPRAFISSVLSPSLLISRILSPSAFRYKLLSPSFMSAVILTPETFKASILSPNALGARVLSPDVLTTKVLSPSLGSLKINSPSIGRLLVLSPSLFGTNIHSKSRMVIQILSPSIMGISINPRD